MATFITPIKLRHEIIPEGTEVTNSNPLQNNGRVAKGESYYSDDGVYSERIFGAEGEKGRLEKTGWINFDNNYVINPQYYDRVAKLFQKSKLEQIISYDRKISTEGRILTVAEAELEEAGKRTRQSKPVEDANIGLVEFRHRFPELLEKYVTQSKIDDDEGRTYREVVRAYLSGDLWIDAFPIVSAQSRPSHFSNKTFKFSEINNYYNRLIAQVNILKSISNKMSAEEDQRLQILSLYSTIQGYVNDIFGYIVNQVLKGKRGVLRKSISAGRVNYSARNVISPDPLLGVGEVSLNYQTFAVLHEELLINLVHRYKKINFVLAREWVRSRESVYDEELYSYMVDLLENTKGGIHVIINRNPSISISSMAIVQVKRIKTDIRDLTMGVSNSIIGGMGEQKKRPYKIVE